MKKYLSHYKKGFTLIELLVVVLIIGILAAIALPQYEKTVEKSRAAEGALLLKSWVEATKIYALENPGTFYYAPTDVLNISFPHSSGNTFWTDHFMCYISPKANAMGYVECSRQEVSTSQGSSGELATPIGSAKYKIVYEIDINGEVNKSCTNSGTENYCSVVKSVFGIE